jgi:hypothetical protein
LTIFGAAIDYPPKTIAIATDLPVIAEFAEEANLPVVIVESVIFAFVIVPSPTKEPEMPFEIFAEKIVAPVFARNEILLSESVLIDDTTICPAIMIP